MIKSELIAKDAAHVVSTILNAVSASLVRAQCIEIRRGGMHFTAKPS